MGTSTPRLNASAAAARLGVSIKALRLYEQHGLVTPERTPAGSGVVRRQDSSRPILRAIAGLTACTGSKPKNSSTCRATSSRSLSAQIM